MNHLQPLFSFLRWLALLTVLLGVASPALAGKTYTINSGGTVTDPTTGLTWMRCAMGQKWDGTTCTGTAGCYDWDQAKTLTLLTFAGQSDWRLPNIRELQTIVDRSVFDPAIDSVAFPNTPSSHFWSGSPDANDSSYAWYVYFHYGNANLNNWSFSHLVRLVRGGQSFGLLDIARPSTDYADQGNGTVIHNPTGLTWQRCAVGQSWTGSACTGTPGAFTWDTARLLTSSLAGETDWRLPTVEELVSLVDYTQYAPAINTTQFPNTLSSYFWSGSPYAGYSSSAWLVNFGYGNAYGSRGYGPLVRLVRGGQSFVPLSFRGNRNTYRIVKTSTGFTVTDQAGSSTALANNVTSIQFADIKVNLLIGDLSKTIATSDLKTLIELYVAFFNRVPEADGLAYWIGQAKAGMTLDQIAEAFYQAAVAYSDLTDYSSSMSHADFVRIIYQNVLGRSGATAPPDVDVQYWAGQLSSGQSSRGQLLSTMLNSAHSFAGDATWGWVPQLLDNKITVATRFAIEQGLNYNTPAESITKGMAIAAAVTPTSTDAAVSLMNIADTGFNLTLP